ncbi:MAG TPA: hypothetical protein VFQ25_12835 [Ktedonobacterales bacterium]|nr:hypothetical protein [Ktedonobacterales bacterium]
MTSDEDDGYAPREPLTPLYTGPDEPAPTPSSRSPRQGPLGARLSQRASAPPAAPASQPLAFGAPAPAYTPGGPAPSDDELTPSAPSSGGGAAPTDPRGQQRPNWGRVTGMLRLDDRVTGALHADLSFGATWSSRSEMLRACLDEYYRLVATYNEARRLLDQSGGDIEALRSEQAAAALRLREVEARLEFHSRAELREVYLGAAEIEARLFRAEEERDLLRSRAELLEGFMAFLSRIIATVRAIPANVVIASDGRAGGVSSGPIASAGADAPVSEGSQETVLYQDPQRWARRAPSAPSAPSRGLRDARPESDLDEFILDADEAALLASGEFEIIGVVEEGPEDSGEALTSGAAASQVTHEAASEKVGDAGGGETAAPGRESE